MILSWNTTDACPLACAHCYRSAGNRGREDLSREEGMALLDQAEEAGFRMVIFSGGEPLERPDLEDLASHARRRSLRPVLGTCGLGLDRARARSLKRAGVARAGISLDSAAPGLHDELRGRGGAWEGALRACEACGAVGLPFQIHTTLFPWNLEELEAIHRLSRRLGSAAHHIFFLVRTGRGRELPGEDRGWYRKALERIRGMERESALEIKAVCAPQYVGFLPPEHRRGKGCLAGRSYAVVTPRGDVRPCAYLDQVAGNVRETSFAVLWRESSLLRQFREPGFAPSCVGCALEESCGGCRARALAETGSAGGRDPWCLRDL